MTDFAKIVFVCGIVAAAMVFFVQKRMECRGKGGVLVHWTCIDKQAIK